MKRALAQVAAGLLFGAGLALSGMTRAEKVLGFLDVAGHWDPSLLFVLGGAVVTATLGYRWVFGLGRPLFDRQFNLPLELPVDSSLVLGSALFGIGWGISGFCPGPAIALLAVPGNRETWIFLGGLVAGMFAAGLTGRLRPGVRPPMRPARRVPSA